MNKLSRSASMQKINQSRDLQNKSSRKEMKNYLISQVLFDGEENVSAAVKSSSRLKDVQEELDISPEDRRATIVVEW